jgi:hypothetical protein
VILERGGFLAIDTTKGRQAKEGKHPQLQNL